MPVLSIARSPKATAPLTSNDCVSVPFSATPPPLLKIETVAVPLSAVGFPKRSTAWAATAGAMVACATASVGCWL